MNNMISKLEFNPETGLCRHISFKEPFSILTSRESEEELLLIQEILRKFPFFGENSIKNWKILKRIQDPHFKDRYTILLKQFYQEIPTFSGEIRVHLIQNHLQRAVLSIDCFIIPETHKTSMEERISTEEAIEIAKFWALSHGESEVSIAKLEKVIYSYSSINHKALWLQVFSDLSEEFKHNLFISLLTGEVINSFSVVKNALSREIWYSAYRSTSRPYWTEGQRFPTNNSDANELINYTESTYNIMFNAFGIRSFDQNDGKMIGVFDAADSPSQPGCRSANAFWNGISVNFCNGLTKMDVVAHEWGHAYIEYSADLIYQSQSGALNEGFADVIGETVQILLGTSYPTRNDSCGSGKRWVLGDEVTLPGIQGGVRDMYNPNCFNNPRSVNDVNYVQCGTADNAGVHTNSGILNQAYSISVDGISSSSMFGDLPGLGLTKSFHIFLRALLVKMGSGSTFSSTASALKTSCSELIGSPLNDPETGFVSNLTISSTDCNNLEGILEATHMSDPFCGRSADTPTYPILLGFFPPIGYAGVEPATTLFYLAQSSFSADVSETICVFVDSDDSFISSVDAAFYNFDYSLLIACRTPVRDTIGEQISTLLSWSGDSNDAQSNSRVTFTYTEPITISSISPSDLDGDNEEVVTINGSGFEDYSLCLGGLDVNGDVVDCLACIFGRIDISVPVAATFIDSTRMSCIVPPRWKLLDQSDELDVWVSKNNQIFFSNPVVTIRFENSNNDNDNNDNDDNNSPANDNSSSATRVKVSLLLIVLCYLLIILS